jgi:hypothetical protein
MSKTKNTPEFQKMMDDIELANSFHYAEQEMEKQELLRDLAMQEAINDAVNVYIEAQKVFIEAQRVFQEQIDAYNKYKGGLTKEEQKIDDTTTMLRDMFEGFNPNV